MEFRSIISRKQLDKFLHLMKSKCTAVSINYCISDNPKVTVLTLLLKTVWSNSVWAKENVIVCVCSVVHVRRVPVFLKSKIIEIVMEVLWEESCYSQSFRDFWSCDTVASGAQTSPKTTDISQNHWRVE